MIWWRRQSGEAGLVLQSGIVMYAYEMYVYELYYKMHVHEIHAHEMHPYNILADEMYNL